MPETPQSPATLDLTVIRTHQSVPARKTVELASDGTVRTIKGYNRVFLWTRSTLQIPHDIDALGAAIVGISKTPDACLVTGEPIGPVELNQPAQRLKHPKDTAPATLGECSAAWLPVDCDKIPLSSPLDPLDPEPAIAEVVGKLGAPFADCSYCWQLTASATPGADRLSVRLFFLTDLAITNATRKQWAKGLISATGVSLVDDSLYSAEHIIYTANAEFRGHDPFPRRCGVAYGELESVPWDRVAIADTPLPSAYSGADFSGSVHRTIQEWLDVIGDGEKQEGFHGPIRSAIWQMVYHRWTPDRIKAQIRHTVFAADASRHTIEYLRSETSDSALNSSIKGAAQRIKSAQTPPRVTQTRLTDDAVSVDVAVARIREGVSMWLRGEGPAKLVLDVTVGATKTTTTVQTIIDELAPGKNILWAFPTHEQGEEVLQRFNAGNAPFFRTAVRIEGRVRETEGTKPLCARPEVVRKIQAAGLSRYTATIACKSGKETCPHWHGCEYYRQFMGKERVRLVPHALLTHPAARAFSDDFMTDCAGLVIDESPLNVMVGRKHYPIASVLDGGGVLAEVITAFREGADMDADTTIPRLEAEMEERCVVEIPASGPDESQQWALEQELARLAESKAPRYLALYKGAIARLQGEVNLLWFGKTTEGEAVFCAWKTDLPPIERVLVLDGTADHEVYKAILGDDVHIERIHVEQNLEIIQAIDAPVGKRKLTDPKNDGVLAQAVALARATGAGLITNKGAIDLAIQKKYLPADHPRGHFNALRGVNHMEELDSLVIAGRPEPDALSVEAHARALWSREALNLSGAYVWRTDGLSSVASHPDARCDGLLRAFREAEIAQGIGRLRAVWAKKTKRVYLLTHTPTGLPVTARPFADIVPSVPLSRLLIAGNGVAPLAPSLMSRMVPDLWATPEAAKAWAKWNLKGAFALGRDIYKGNAPFKFRVTGQKRHSTALSWLDDFETWQMLENITGKEVVDCQRMDSTPAKPSADTTITSNGIGCETAAFTTNVNADDGCTPTADPLIRRSTLYARLMSPVRKLRVAANFKPSPRNAHPPDWGELVRDHIPIPPPQPAYAGGYL